jgi:hypothetical protein
MDTNRYFCIIEHRNVETDTTQTEMIMEQDIRGKHGKSVIGITGI